MSPPRDEVRGAGPVALTIAGRTCWRVGVEVFGSTQVIEAQLTLDAAALHLRGHYLDTIPLSDIRSVRIARGPSTSVEIETVQGYELSIACLRFRCFSLYVLNRGGTLALGQTLERLVDASARTR